MQEHMLLHTRQSSTQNMLLHTRQASTQNNKYQVSHNTVVSPGDGHIVAQNMYRLINILRINCAPSWLYLQDYTETHGQQNIKKLKLLLAWLQASAAKQLINALFWALTQREADSWPLKMGLMGSPKRRQEITAIRCISDLKSAVLNFYVPG